MAPDLGGTYEFLDRVNSDKNPTRTQPEKEMVGATGFEIAFCLFRDFGLVRYLAE